MLAPIRSTGNSPSIQSPLHAICKNVSISRKIGGDGSRTTLNTSHPSNPALPLQAKTAHILLRFGGRFGAVAEPERLQGQVGKQLLDRRVRMLPVCDESHSAVGTGRRDAVAGFQVDGDVADEEVVVRVRPSVFCTRNASTIGTWCFCPKAERLVVNSGKAMVRLLNPPRRRQPAGLQHHIPYLNAKDISSATSFNGNCREMVGIFFLGLGCWLLGCCLGCDRLLRRLHVRLRLVDLNMGMGVLICPCGSLGRSNAALLAILVGSHLYLLLALGVLIRPLHDYPASGGLADIIFRDSRADFLGLLMHLPRNLSVLPILLVHEIHCQALGVLRCLVVAGFCSAFGRDPNIVAVFLRHLPSDSFNTLDFFQVLSSPLHIRSLHRRWADNDRTNWAGN